MKLPRLITRRRHKWTGLVLCVLLLGVYVASAWYQAWWVIVKPNQEVFIRGGHGALLFEWIDFDALPSSLPFRDEWFFFRQVHSPWIELWPRWVMQGTGSPPVSPGLRSMLRRRGTPAFTWSYATLPLWFPLLLIAAPTALLWYTDRRAKPWQCAKCRYDLRGITATVCPECGTPTGPEA